MNLYEDGDSEDDLAWQLQALNARDSDEDEHDSGLQVVDWSKPGVGTMRKSTRTKKPPKLPRHQAEAIRLLQQITGNSTAELTSALYKTFLVPSDQWEYKEISKYVRRGQDHGFGIEVVNIIRIVRNNDFEFSAGRSDQHVSSHRRRRHHVNNVNFQQPSSALTPNPLPILGQNYNPNGIPGGVTPTPASGSKNHLRMMVWHGTKKQHVSSILLNGFAIPQAKNQMFGRGIYFADRASKSAQYCDGTSPGKFGYMFLCDVKLGEMYKARQAHNGNVQAPPGFDTVKCCGQRRPDWDQNGNMKGAILPYGRTVDDVRFQNYTLVFNEYIAYEPERVKAKYLVVVKFHTHVKRRNHR